MATDRHMSFPLSYRRSGNFIVTAAFDFLSSLAFVSFVGARAGN
jgi:hypothetical protein